jgi:hypothetical protein
MNNSMHKLILKEERSCMLWRAIVSKLKVAFTRIRF